VVAIVIVDLEIANYKSLKHVVLKDLPSFAVLVGANAAGKSNFVDALDFLSATLRSGLASAIAALSPRRPAAR